MSRSMTFSRASLAVVVYACLYAASLSRLSGAPEFEAGESLAVLLVFGLGFSAIAWAVTRGASPAPVVVRAPGREFGTVVVYLAAFALLVLGWGLTAIRQAVASDPAQSVAILLLKLAAMVAAPALIFRGLGYRWRDLFACRAFGRTEWRTLAVMALLLALLQALVGRGVRQLGTLDVSPWLVLAVAPLAWVWESLEAGLTEEFLFRALLQTRAAAVLRSEVTGIVAMAVLFGLAHAPGYVLRGGHAMEGMISAPDALTAAAYAIVVVSPIGFMFGVLWSRTRHLWLLVVLHGWTDLFPNLAEFLKAWRLA